MKLYYVPGACSLSPHIIAREAGVPLELERVDLATRKTESGADYREVNPNGYVPAVRLDGGEVLTEGPAIVQYIADLHPETGLAPKPGTIDRARTQAQLNFVSTELHKSFVPLFVADSTDAEKAKAKAKIGQRFDHVERVLGDGRPYFSGQNFTVSDAYLFVVANWTKPTGIDLAQWPKLAAFVGRVAGRPKVQEALKAEGLA
jgi:glutathione S-transferase